MQKLRESKRHAAVALSNQINLRNSVSSTYQAINTYNKINLTSSNRGGDCIEINNFVNRKSENTSLELNPLSNKGYMKVIYESDRVRQKKRQLKDQKRKILDFDLKQHK